MNELKRSYKFMFISQTIVKNIFTNLDGSFAQRIQYVEIDND